MTLSSIHRFAPIIPSFLPKLHVHPIAFKQSKLYPLMQSAFKNGQFAPLMTEWEGCKAEKWDDKVTPLHEIARHMPVNRKIFHRFIDTIGGRYDTLSYRIPSEEKANFEPLLLDCTKVKNANGETPQHIALQQKNWRLADYLQRYNPEEGYEIAMKWLKSIETQFTAVERGTPIRSMFNDFDVYDSILHATHVATTSSDDWKEKDENGWTLAHWLAFRGISKGNYPPEIQNLWDSDRDNRRVSPDEVAGLIQFIAQANSSEEAEMHKKVLNYLPEERKNELLDVIQARIQAYRGKIQNGLSLLPDDLVDLHYIVASEEANEHFSK